MSHPCTQCGRCCKEMVCAIGEHVSVVAFGKEWEPPCPGIIWHQGKAWCAFVLAEKTEKREPAIAQALGIGKGCDAEPEGEQPTEQGEPT